MQQLPGNQTTPLEMQAIGNSVTQSNCIAHKHVKNIQCRKAAGGRANARMQTASKEYHKHKRNKIIRCRQRTPKGYHTTTKASDGKHNNRQVLLDVEVRRHKLNSQPCPNRQNEESLPPTTARPKCSHIQIQSNNQAKQRK